MKKLLSIILTAVFVLVLSTSTAFASETGYKKVSEYVEKANEKIYEMICKADEKADANSEMTDKIIEKLVDKTNKIAADVKEKAAEAGYEVICEMVEVEIGGKIVLIDPLRIAGF